MEAKPRDIFIGSEMSNLAEFHQQYLRKHIGGKFIPPMEEKGDIFQSDLKNLRFPEVGD
jgi:hypothetical protein